MHLIVSYCSGDFELWIKTVKMLFGSITQEQLGLPTFGCYFRAPQTICYKMHMYFLNDSDNFKMLKTYLFGVGGIVHP